MKGVIVFLVVYFCVTVYTFAQQTENIRIPSSGETCNVINVNCGTGRSRPTEQDEIGLQGKPGKRGQIGPVGPAGLKGDMGAPGPKGNEGRSVDVSVLKREVLSILDSTTCTQLNTEHGITESGIYLLRPFGGTKPVYAHCDFIPRKGVATCAELMKKYKVTYSGFYNIKPDDSAPSFEVYCHFSGTSAVTEIWHDSMDEIEITPKCEPSGCFSKTPNYGAEMEQIARVINNSTSCKQYIKLRCSGVVLLQSEIGWWVSREGEKQNYWGGSWTMRAGYCACGEVNKCVDSTKKCNCDNNAAGLMTQDEGYLIDKTKLPVREMRFGDAGDPEEYAWHTLGKLLCMG